MKTCSKCGERPKRVSGGYCQPCQTAYNAEWLAARPGYTAARRAQNLDAAREYTRLYLRKRRAEKPEECKAYAREYYRLNKDRLNAARRSKSAANCPEKAIPVDKCCNECKITKPLSEFTRRGDRGPFSVVSRCKVCCLEKQQKYQQQEYVKEKGRRYKKELYANDPAVREAIRQRSKRQNSREEVKQARRERYPRVREKLNTSRRIARRADPEKARRLARERRKASPDKYRDYARKSRKNRLPAIRAHMHKRYHSDPQFKLAANLRGRMRAVLKRVSAIKSASTFELTGCSVSFLRAHLESFFKPGMTWENHGPVWHIDHKKPCSKFNLTDPEQQKACFHFSNLQPLFALDNILKSDHYED